MPIGPMQFGTDNNAGGNQTRLRTQGIPQATLWVQNEAAAGTQGRGLTVEGGVLGVLAQTTSGAGVIGTGSASLPPGSLPPGISTTGVGVLGVGTTYGVRAQSATNTGVYGTSSANQGNGVIGEANVGSIAYGVWGRSTSGYAGKFHGKVDVVGDLSKTGGGFKIDHPFAPENKYVRHSFVESPDRKNVYDGIAQLDKDGSAWIELPEWFGELNRDYRYQLTAIGAPAPDLHIAEEISENRFRMAGGPAGVRVSWQVTGIRKDAWAEMNRIVVEEDKPDELRGTYLHPEAFGEPETRGEDYAQEEALRSHLAETSEARRPAVEEEPDDST